MNSHELSESGFDHFVDGIKVSLKEIFFRSLFWLKHVCCAYFECICEAMLDSLDLPDETLAKQGFCFK